jgi:nucleolar complex protein 3
MIFFFLGRNHDNLETFLRTIEALFLVGRKKVTANSTLSFVKRLSSLSLQTLHNSSLGILAALRTIIQVILFIIYLY